ncbi:prostaglandin reductase 1-like [Cimex lectularius]|uniref:Prostaglandin reductase 1 n=1 Tax=Cimex lectularius TaxID=79782 RepID=A0A8I6RVD5_CIMLE|nr:prostaglandin reductase 1-like [Cimex lectularius]
MKAKKFVFKKHFEGVPKKTDFELVEQDLPPVKDREVLFEALFISVDPYMRAISPKLPTGITMIGTQVAKVLESKHPDYKKGDLVLGPFGWVTHTVQNPDEVLSPFGEKTKPYVLPDLGGFSPSTALGVLGMPGNTAWFGLTELCKPKSGEVLVVSGAAGAVGSLVGQIGKILGLTVIGFAGSDEKCKMLVKELGFDYAFNYKTKPVPEALQEAAPNGVDCYFDNVGGRMSNDVMNHMNMFGRVANCGSISVYNSDPKDPPLAPVLQPTIVMKQLTLQGFISSRWKDRWFEGIQKNLQFMKEGKLKFKETMVEGFENMFEAFTMLFTGENIGKTVVKV